MSTTFTIAYAALRTILAALRRQPYHVAVGAAGFNLLRSGRVEILAGSFRLVHEGALRSHQDTHTPRFELGFVPFTLRYPQIWEAVAMAARLDGDRPVAPTCSLLLGSGEDIGRFTGILSVQGQIVPVQTLHVVGPGMHRLRAVDFQALHRSPLSPNVAERWSRLVGALGGQEIWQRLTALRFCLSGAGRTGSLIATTLTRQGVQSLSMIDPDVVERANLDAMDAVTERDLGRRKVTALTRKLRQILPHTDITALPQSILSCSNACRKQSQRPMRSWKSIASARMSSLPLVWRRSLDWGLPRCRIWQRVASWSACFSKSLRVSCRQPMASSIS